MYFSGIFTYDNNSMYEKPMQLVPVETWVFQLQTVRMPLHDRKGKFFKVYGYIDEINLKQNI